MQQARQQERHQLRWCCRAAAQATQPLQPFSLAFLLLAAAARALHRAAASAGGPQSAPTAALRRSAVAIQRRLDYLPQLESTQHHGKPQHHKAQEARGKRQLVEEGGGELQAGLGGATVHGFMHPSLHAAAGTCRQALEHAQSAGWTSRQLAAEQASGWEVGQAGGRAAGGQGASQAGAHTFPKFCLTTSSQAQ